MMKNISINGYAQISLMIFAVGIFQVPVFAQMSDMPEPAAAQTGDLNVGFNRPPSAEQILNEAKAEPSTDLHDHLAKVYQVFGDVKILKKGQADWAHAFPNMTLEVGDQVLTGNNSYMDIAYDSKFLNVARIQANTKAEFRSIEPTNLVLEDGSIFNALDGLSGENYQISTPTAVAGVRGTTFLAFSTGLFDVYPDKSPHVGEIYVELKEGDETVSLVEGQSFDAADPEQGVTDIPQERMAGAEEMMEIIGGFRPDTFSSEAKDLASGDSDSKEGSTEDGDMDGDQKTAGNGPNDNDGDSGDFGAQRSDSTDADADSLMPKDFDGEVSGSNEGAVDSLADNLIPKNEKQMTDMNAVVDFFAAGGMGFSGEGSEGNPGDTAGHSEFHQVLENMGMEDIGEKFDDSTAPMENYGDGAAGGGNEGTMENMGETYTFVDPSGADNMNGGYIDPSSIMDPNQLIDPQTFLPKDTTTEIVQEAIKEETQSSGGDDPASENPNDGNDGHNFVSSGG